MSLRDQLIGEVLLRWLSGAIVMSANC